MIGDRERCLDAGMVSILLYFVFGGGMLITVICDCDMIRMITSQVCRRF